MSTQPTLTPQLIHHFVQALGQALRLLQQLETTMLDETRALASRDPDLLQQIVIRKEALVLAVEKETLKQKQSVEMAAQPFTPAGLAAFFAAGAAPQMVREQWAQLCALGLRCAQLNQANARLIEQDRKRIANLLRILSGDDAPSATYTPQGRTQSASSRSRTLIRA